MRCSDLRLPGNGKRLCLLALHYSCLILGAACAIAAATRREAWQRLACSAGGGSLAAAGGPGGLDFALVSAVGGGTSLVNASDAFGLVVGPVLLQLAGDSRAWTSISWLLAGASVAIVATLMALALKKFCCRARALAMTGVAALLVGISTGALTAAIIVYLAAAARLRALFDTVAAAAAASPHNGSGGGGVSVSFNGDSGAAGFALTVAADLACFGDLLLLAVKRLAFARNREASSYNVEAAQAAAATDSAIAEAATSSARTETTEATTPAPLPPPSPPPRAHRLKSLAPPSEDQQTLDPGPTNAATSEHLRRRLERRQEAERRAPPSGGGTNESFREVARGVDNLAMEPTTPSGRGSSSIVDSVDCATTADEEEPIVSVDAL